MNKRLIKSEVVRNQYGDKFTLSLFEGNHVLLAYDRHSGSTKQECGYQWLSPEQCKEFRLILQKGEKPDGSKTKTATKPRVRPGK